MKLGLYCLVKWNDHSDVQFLWLKNHDKNKEQCTIVSPDFVKFYKDAAAKRGDVCKLKPHSEVILPNRSINSFMEFAEYIGEV